LIAGVREIGVPLGVVGESDADVVIDFSVPDAAVAVIAHCVEFSRPVVQIIAGEMEMAEHRHGRSGRPGQRPRDEIGYHAIRAGDNPGEHSILFGMLGETLTIRVAASNRDCYAQGALLAAEWIVNKPPGLYGMSDVLGL
jgi:dihydrodipicolinate reductase